jgi:hypothetical protein
LLRLCPIHCRCHPWRLSLTTMSRILRTFKRAWNHSPRKEGPRVLTVEFPVGFYARAAHRLPHRWPVIGPTCLSKATSTSGHFTGTACMHARSSNSSHFLAIHWRHQCEDEEGSAQHSVQASVPHSCYEQGDSQEPSYRAPGLIDDQVVPLIGPSDRSGPPGPPVFQTRGQWQTLATCVQPPRHQDLNRFRNMLPDHVTLKNHMLTAPKDVAPSIKGILDQTCSPMLVCICVTFNAS